jgi:hypothetical protein
MIFIKYNPRQINTTYARVVMRERTIVKAIDVLVAGRILVKFMTSKGKRIDTRARTIPITLVFLVVVVITSKWR